MGSTRATAHCIQGSDVTDRGVDRLAEEALMTRAPVMEGWWETRR